VIWQDWLARMSTSEQALPKTGFLARLTPRLRHPRLWITTRQAVARGAAIGVFFGLLLPLAQIPAAAVLCLPLRANIGVAIASTFVTNPLTFPPIYVGAYRVGSWLLQPPARRADVRALHSAIEEDEGNAKRPGVLRSIGRPLAVGLGIFATLGALGSYVAVSLLWNVAGRLKPERPGTAP